MSVFGRLYPSKLKSITNITKRNFSNSETNYCEVGIQGAEEDKERDVDEKEVAESVLKLD